MSGRLAHQGTVHVEPSDVTGHAAEKFLPVTDQPVERLRLAEPSEHEGAPSNP